MGRIDRLLPIRALRYAAEVLFPAHCHICGQRPAPDNQWFCSHCLESMPLTRFETSENNPMVQRLAGRVPFRHAGAYVFYHSAGRMAPVFHDFKYNGCRDLARYMGQLAGKSVELSFLYDVDALVPIPIHWTKRLHRGYNQTMQIALGLSETMHIPISTSLKARRPHRTQTHLTAEQRYTNLEGVFRYHPEPQFTGKHVAVIDDVCTTGTTLISAAKAILAADPSATVSLFTLGVVP